MALKILDKHSIEIVERNIRGKFGREIIFNSTDFSVEVTTHDPTKIKGIREIFDFINFRTGNEPDSRSSVFHAEIRRHMRELKLTDYEEYKDVLLSKRKLSEDLISKITNHTTEWFRYPDQLLEMNSINYNRNKDKYWPWFYIKNKWIHKYRYLISCILRVTKKLPR